MKKKDKLDIGARALARNIRVSAIKIRPILDQIRGCSYGKALVLPEFTPYKTCYLISQLIPSAAANANTHFGLNKSDLFISEARVESYTYLRRFRPRAQGRSYPIKKPICKVTIKSNSNIIGEIKR